MATIGTFTFAQNGRFEGKVTTFTINTRLNIVPVTKSSDDQPDYRIYADRAELGAGWRKTSDRGNDYVSLVLDDPSFAAPVCIGSCGTGGGATPPNSSWRPPSRCAATGRRLVPQRSISPSLFRGSSS
jgi:uncharacterized protein (DUF736 family)